MRGESVHSLHEKNCQGDFVRISIVKKHLRREKKNSTTSKYLFIKI